MTTDNVRHGRIGAVSAHRIKARKRTGGLYPKGSAFHEAAHAVMRGRIGLEPTAIEIHHNGEGFTHGTGEPYMSRGQYEVWDQVVYSLAGVYAEARACKISVVAAMLMGGHEDLRRAKEALLWLVTKGYAADDRAAWRRAEDATRDAIRETWPCIKAIAERLRQTGQLKAAEVAEIMEAHQ